MTQTNLIGKNILGYTVSEKLGSGAFGTVYKAIKTNVSGQYIRALKHITIPTERQYNSVLSSMGGDVSKADSYFAQMLNNIVSEIKILNDLSEKGVQHIVRYYENDICVSESPKRYDIYILMEYLTPLEEYIQKTDFLVRDVIRLGLDILNGLKSCHDNGVIHRDVKDDNIFVSDGGEYKIGDFGISKMLKDSSKAESLKGTPNFLAPEVFLGKESYTKSVDLYSLGIVLYRLLNYNRNPFLPNFPEQYYAQDETAAFEQRMSGKIPQPPLLGGEEVGHVIVKAISGKAERFQTAEEFMNALEQAIDNTSGDIFNIQVKNDLSIKEISEKQEEKLGKKLGEISNSSDIENEIDDEENKSINKHLFESIGKDSLENGYKEQLDTNIEQNHILKKINNDNYIEKNDKKTKITLNESSRRKKEVGMDKNMVSKIIFLIPVLILIIGVAAYFIIIPGIYGKVISFIDWLFTDSQNIIDTLRNSNVVLSHVNSIIVLKLFWWVWLASLMISLFFIGKRLQNQSELIVSNAILKKNEPYLMIKKINSALKQIKIHNVSKQLDVLIYRVKQLEERLSVESDFGYGKSEIIYCENDIATQIQKLLKLVSNIEKGRLEENINTMSEIIVNVNFLLDRRTELKRK